MDDCIRSYIEDKIRCQLPWGTDKKTWPKCTENHQYQDFLNSHDEIASLSGFSIAKRTGCLPSCNINEYTMTSFPGIISDGILGDTEPHYMGVFYYPGGRYWEKIYHYNYDFTSYIADVGGLVGLVVLPFWSSQKMIWSFYDGVS